MLQVFKFKSLDELDSTNPIIIELSSLIKMFNQSEAILIDTSVFDKLLDTPTDNLEQGRFKTLLNKGFSIEEIVLFIKENLIEEISVDCSEFSKHSFVENIIEKRIALVGEKYKTTYQNALEYIEKSAYIELEKPKHYECLRNLFDGKSKKHKHFKKLK